MTQQVDMDSLAQKLQISSAALAKEVAEHLPSVIDRELFFELSVELRPEAFRRIVNEAKPPARELVEQDFDETQWEGVNPQISLNRGRDVIDHISICKQILTRFENPTGNSVRLVSQFANRYKVGAIEVVEAIVASANAFAMAFFGRDIMPMGTILDLALSDILSTDKDAVLLYYPDPIDFFRAYKLGNWSFEVKE